MEIIAYKADSISPYTFLVSRGAWKYNKWIRKRKFRFEDWKWAFLSIKYWPSSRLSNPQIEASRKSQWIAEWANKFCVEFEET